MQEYTNTYAPGWPGSPPKWNSSKKTGVGVSLNPLSQVWFTTSHGILNEIYYPRVDCACIRDMGFLISDGKNFFSEEKRHTETEVQYIEAGVPAYRFINTCTKNRYRINKEVIADPQRDTLLQRIVFEPLKGKAADYNLYALMAPHIMNAGAGNTAWCGSYKGMRALFAKRGNTAVAMICSIPFKNRTVGFVGSSDAWQEVVHNKALHHRYERAENGNVAVCGEIDLAKAGKEPIIVAIGFGMNANEAAQRARASILNDYDRAREEYINGWKQFQASITDYYPKGAHKTRQGKKEEGQRKRSKLNLFRLSAAAILAHHTQQFPGGFIASLSIPWGFSKGDDDLGGYHLVWPRDLVEVSGGMLAAGMHGNAIHVLRFLRLVQEEDGHWFQNMWLDGSDYWSGIQLDETAFPILLTGMLVREGALKKEELDEFIPMVRAAAKFLIQNGPCSEQDRWEENAGYSPFTLAVEVSALLVAADILEWNKERKVARYLRETADMWNDNIEAWTYVTDTEDSKAHGVDGYYVRIAPPDVGVTPTLDDDIILIKNLPHSGTIVSTKVVSPDALALVRFGLRAADDPKILNTIKIVDATLKTVTPYGDCWHRYSYDGYGEHADGSPFNGTGIGRAWPLLTGERAHYEIAAGNFDRAAELLESMENFSNEGGMIPEQIWDAEDIPEKELFFGRPAGSAMPLVWAHSEYMKLCRSLHDKAIFDQPEKTYQRYVVQKKKPSLNFWRFNRKLRSISKRKKKLRIEAKGPFRLHWSLDGWQTATDTDSKDSEIGMHLVDLDLTKTKPGDTIQFTFYWPEVSKWEGKDFTVAVSKD